MIRSLLRWGLVAALLVSACAKPAGREPGRKDGGTKEQVNLPPRPNLAGRQAAEKYPDGALSVEGFLRQARDMVGKSVTVRGTVLSVESCPPNTELCKVVPHIVLVDDANAPKRKLQVVSEPTEYVLNGFAAKSTQTFTGKIALWSPDSRLINLDGLLVINPPEPPPAAAAPAAGAPAATLAK